MWLNNRPSAPFGDIWVPSAGGTDVVRVHIR
jgi:hypothetical protein